MPTFNAANKFVVPCRTSATFSANSGSLLTLNVPCFYGRSPFSRHSFAT